MDILDGFQKLVSTRRTISISISIGLDCRDPQGQLFCINSTLNLNLTLFLDWLLPCHLEANRRGRSHDHRHHQGPADYGQPLQGRGPHRSQLHQHRDPRLHLRQRRNEKRRALQALGHLLFSKWTRSSKFNFMIYLAESFYKHT